MPTRLGVAGIVGGCFVVRKIRLLFGSVVIGVLVSVAAAASAALVSFVVHCGMIVPGLVLT
ncbi:MAG: hypothetical protein HYX29_07430 [Solirubrobacterales bacterium]|nr:hypothetical protein [Solirubrobacterales bacterium]